jgi:hypothetical protein
MRAFNIQKGIRAKCFTIKIHTTWRVHYFFGLLMIFKKNMSDGYQ